MSQLCQRTEDALSRDGVAVTRAVYPEAAGEACAAPTLADAQIS